MKENKTEEQKEKSIHEKTQTRIDFEKLNNLEDKQYVFASINETGVVVLSSSTSKNMYEVVTALLVDNPTVAKVVINDIMNQMEKDMLEFLAKSNLDNKH